MLEWAAVIILVVIAAMIYFLYRGVRLAFSNHELPDADEGDYVIKVIARLGKRGYLAVMSRHEPKDET